ncbi:MAG: ribose-phosphate diphosphokinase, partial [Anaerolineales bacterium]
SLAAAGDGGHIPFLDNIDFRFSDSEASVRLEKDVSGNDVFLFQALFDAVSGTSVDQNLMSFMIAVRAFREWGAGRITAVLPYLAYARQDKPSEFKREPTTAKLVADLIVKAGLDRLITWDPHYGTVHGFFEPVPVTRLRSLNLFARVFEQYRGREDVIVVAPDAGVSKYISYFSRKLDLSSAFASKYRPEPEKAVISDLVGSFSGKRTAIILDDMISTGGTIFSLVEKLVAEKSIQEILVGVSHNLCLPVAIDRIREMFGKGWLKQIVVTNSIPQSEAFESLSFSRVEDLSRIFVGVINRLHYNYPVSELLSDPD